jgi:hypothetical protein
VIDWLRKIETLFESFFERTDLGARSRVAPLDLVRQIQREVDRNCLPFVNDQILVPHRIVIHLFAPAQAVVDEYEALFNTAEFRDYIEHYITGRGYTLRDRLRVVLHCHQDKIPEFDRSGCYLEFSWPHGPTDSDELTVALDTYRGGRDAHSRDTQNTLPVKATLEVLEGVAYESRLEIRVSEFNLGRTQNIIQEDSAKVVRTNHLAFMRPEPGDVVNRSVSRAHATIVWNGKDFLLYDCGSENGTRVERGRTTIPVSRRGDRSEPAALQDGDIVLLGNARIRFACAAGEPVV